jgi:hypothetical protein
MQINGFSMNGDHSEKTSGTINKISIYISQHFDQHRTATDFLKILSITPHQALSFLRNAVFIFGIFLSFDHSRFLGSHTLSS